MTIQEQHYLVQTNNRRNTVYAYKVNQIQAIRNYVEGGGDLNDNPELLGLYSALVTEVGNGPFSDLGLILTEDGKAIISE